ncbi:MAG: isoprenylcysteine carboxylmethyltransferase family protein, partial [Syntrophales bacterium]|nr:isoprenylcysteine carboxylmethyltransferase family protein [Syntrophales bacterium]
SRGYKSEHSKNGNFLVRTGPYSFSRNPMYLGIILIGLGAVLTVFKLWVFIFFSAFFLVRYITLVLKEEKILKEKFGGEYSEYQNIVPRFLPRIGRLLKSNIREYLPVRLKWVKKEIGTVITLFVLLTGEH